MTKGFIVEATTFSKVESRNFIKMIKFRESNEVIIAFENENASIHPDTESSLEICSKPLGDYELTFDETTKRESNSNSLLFEFILDDLVHDRTLMSAFWAKNTLPAIITDRYMSFKTECLLSRFSPLTESQNTQPTTHDDSSDLKELGMMYKALEIKP